MLESTWVISPGAIAAACMKTSAAAAMTSKSLNQRSAANNKHVRFFMARRNPAPGERSSGAPCGCHQDIGHSAREFDSNTGNLIDFRALTVQRSHVAALRIRVSRFFDRPKTTLEYN